MDRSLFCVSWLFNTGAIFAAALALSPAHADQQDGHGDRHRRPVYQRHAFEWMPQHAGRFHRGPGHEAQWHAPQVNAGWFQRPYPYHLDYYKMRYGGSYAPYFGNLYGPPEVVTAPPYYGPYYGGGEYGYPNAGAYHGEYPGYPNGAMLPAPIGNAAPNNQSATPTNSNSLPAP